MTLDGSAGIAARRHVQGGGPSTTGTATLSLDGRYRYDLTRRWADGPRVVWVMLNPSTADAEADDHTVRCCIGFSQRLGYGALTVVNLYALRATDPEELGRADDPIGPSNVAYLDLHLTAAPMVIAAWGAHPWASKVADVLMGGHRPLHCLGVTRDGSPRHPSRLRADAQLQEWEPPPPRPLRTHLRLVPAPTADPPPTPGPGTGRG